MVISINIMRQIIDILCLVGLFRKLHLKVKALRIKLKSISEEYVNEASFRVFHEAERELFTIEALGELIQMHSLGILSNENVEQILEHSIIAGNRKISSEQLKSFVANIIFNAQFNRDSGSRMMLMGDEDIN